MKKNLLQEIEKIKFQNRYNPSKTLNENLLTEQAVIKKILQRLTRPEIRLSTKNLNTLSQRLQFFRDTYGDGVYSVLVKLRGGSGNADELIEKVMRGGTLENVDIAHLVQALSKGKDGPVFQKAWADSMDDTINLNGLKSLANNPEALVKFKDVSKYWKHFDDNFIKDTFGIDIKAARESVEATVKKNINKGPSNTQKTINAIKNLTKRIKEYTKDGFWNTKMGRGIGKGADTFLLGAGLKFGGAIFGGPISFLASIVIAQAAKFILNSVLGKSLQWVSKNVGIFGRGATDDLVNIVGKKQVDRLKKSLPSAADEGTYLGQTLFTRGKNANLVVLKRGFWLTLTVMGFLSGLFKGWIDKMFGYLGISTEEAINQMANQTYDQTIMLGTLNGSMYKSITGEDYYTADGEEIGNMAQITGLDADEAVIEESAKMLYEILSIGGDIYNWIDKNLPDMFSAPLEFTEGWTITADDVRAAEKNVVEWFNNTPSLLFISAVSQKMENDYGKNLLQMINEYKESRDQNVLSFITTLGEEGGEQTVISLEKVMKMMQNRPLFSQTLDEFIIDAYGVMMNPSEAEKMKKYIDLEELNCEEKEKLVNNSMRPIVGEMNELIKKLTGEEGNVETEWNCGENSIGLIGVDEIADTKSLLELKKLFPTASNLYFNGVDRVEEIATKGRHEDEAFVEVIFQDLTAKEILGSEESYDMENIKRSSTKGAMYYANDGRGFGGSPSKWCDALESKGIKFQGTCGPKHFKNSPILRTIAGVLMYDPNQKFGITSQDQTSMDVFDELTYTSSKGEDITGKDVEINTGQPTNESVVGLEKILLESRK